MAAITTIAIVLALFLGVAIVIAMRKYYAADRLHRKIKDLNNRLQSYRDSESDCKPSYSVKRVDDIGSKYFGKWAVCRST